MPGKKLIDMVNVNINKGYGPNKDIAVSDESDRKSIKSLISYSFCLDRLFEKR